MEGSEEGDGTMRLLMVRKIQLGIAGAPSGFLSTLSTEDGLRAPYILNRTRPSGSTACRVGPRPSTTDRVSGDEQCQSVTASTGGGGGWGWMRDLRVQFFTMRLISFNYGTYKMD